MQCFWTLNCKIQVFCHCISS